MMSIQREFQHLKISLESIILATNNFAEDHRIGEGGFGKVYKGDLLLSAGLATVALKRLDRNFGQGDSEFWKEVIMLSLYSHENIISLLGFCDEKGEKILVYEYASRKGLHLYLDSNHLTWVQRLKICIGAARGLAYLHDPVGKQQRVLHRDIKSSNILLAENWDAKIADFGLSKFGPANQQFTFIVSNNVAGTVGYCDPLYMESGLLTKESDVYSFGVTLFEVLCGRLCFAMDNKHQSLTQLVRESFKQNNLNGIICNCIKDEIDPSSVEIFSTIAYQCLKRDRKKRPLMTEIVAKLETALQHQEALKDKDERRNKGLLNIADNSDQEPVGEPELSLESVKLENNRNPLWDFEKICPPEGRNAIILYTTTLRGTRKIFEDCKTIKSLLKSYKVFYEERDVSLDLVFKNEVVGMLGTNAVVPRLFIRGRYIGGSEEVLVLHNQGKFQPLLEEWPCEDCGGIRFVPCNQCGGSRKLYSETEGFMKCPECNENGLVRCPICF